MANCKIEGEFTGKVVKTEYVADRFKEGDLDLKLSFVANDEQGKTYLSLSTDYIQKGVNAGRREIDVRVETLAKLGINNDLSNIETLINKDVALYGSVNAKGYYNVYLQSKTEKIVDKNIVSNRLAALLGSAPTTAAAPAPVNPPTSGSDEIPF
jgi:hypothetical protein